jgi:nucleoid DNA-binding protein
MKKEQLARRLAKESHITPGAAADQVDRVVHDILKRFRRGQSTSLPGVGILQPGADRQVDLVPRTLPGKKRGRP